MAAFRVLVLCLTALAFGCASTAPPARPARAAAGALPDLSDYRLGTGDKVRIDVFGEPDLSLDAVVDGMGNINYPLLGTVPAQKRTAGELQQALSAGLAAGYLKDPDVRVAVVQYRPFYTIGQVRKPGAYPYVIGLTVEKAIAIAGGLTNLASTRQLFLVREDASKRIKVGLDALVLPGDTLLVEEGLF